MKDSLRRPIASTISSLKINESTWIFLARIEQQAEEMRSQEEEIREKLTSRQQEMHRKEREYIKRIEELEGQLGAVAR